VSIVLDGLNLTDLATNGTQFEFRRGTPSDLPEYIGQDDSVPGAAGRDPGQWMKTVLPVRLYGQVIGAGSTLAAQQASFRTRMDAVKAAMDVASLVTITTEDLFGVGSATLSNCRPERMVAETEFGDILWIGFLELTCIDSPPEWVTGS
jgi:hypothetical protein